MSLIIPANSASASGGFSVDNSCRFNSGSSDDLRISDYSGAGTSRRIRTYSMWIKRSKLAYSVIFGSAGKDHWVFTADHKIQINIGSGTDSRRITDMVFRDVSAFYHIVFAYDTTQGTASNRFTMWVNGAVATTSIVGGKNEVAQNEDALVFINGDTHTIGSDEADYFDGYMAEWVFVDGQKLDADSFGEYDEDSGIWKPKDVSGINLGTNGFYLNFADSSDLGIDAGNDNDFEPTNLTAIDQSTNTCTNNFATLNPLGTVQLGTLSEGNLKLVSSNAYKIATSTIAVSSGKWYVENKITGSSPDAMLGVIDVQDYQTNSSINYAGDKTNSVGYYKDGRKFIANSASSYGASYTTDDIIGIALDLDSGTKTITFYKNGASQGAINLPTAGSEEWYFLPSPYNATIEVNFGSPSYSESGGNSDGNGYGNFAASVPANYYCLNTKNLAEYG
jgi:hypothetical protein